MCGLVVDWVRLCFWESVLASVYVCRFSVFVCACFVLCVLCNFVFFVFLCFCGGSDSLAPNEDIVRFRCGCVKSYTLLCIFL